MTDTAKSVKPAWFFWAVAVYTAYHMVFFGSLVFDFIAHPLAPDFQLGSVAVRLVMALVVVPIALVVSVLVLRRAPGNVTGLCLLLFVVTITGGVLRPDSPLLPYYWTLNTSWSGLWLLGIYFPDGRPAFPRFERWIRLWSLLFIVLLVIGPLFEPRVTWVSSEGQPIDVPNPLFVPALGSLRPLVNMLDIVVVLPTMFLLPLLSIIVRYRRGDERSRLQIRWLGWAFAILLTLFIVLAPFGISTQNADPARYGIAGWAAFFVWAFYLSLAPYVAVGNAILRHRLYDIDLLINRTLVYGMLTALLALVYVGSVVALQSIFRALTGQQSDLAIVASTLAIAALFQPLRRRIQNMIDRRFYRRKYDAQKTLQAFSVKLRDQTNLDQLTDELISVVDETLHPAHVSLWLRAPERKT